MSNGAANNATVVQPPKSRKAHPTFHFLAGLTSGVGSAVLLQPADLLKTRVQQSRTSSLLPVLRSILSSPHPIAGLWRGTIPSALRTGFGSALYFTSLSSLRQVLANNSSDNNNNAGSSSFPAGDDGRSGSGSDSREGSPPKRTRDRNRHTHTSSSVLPTLSNTQNLLTGATARVFAGFVLMPVTVIKVRYESDLYAYKSIASAARSIYASEGLKGFFSGFGATAVRDAPYAGLYVLFYEACKKDLNKLLSARARLKSGADDDAGQPRPSWATSATINASSGVLAAGLATALTNPFDAVKTRLQLMPQKYGNMVKATRLMLKEDGIKSFFDGLALRMGRKALSSALAWTVYEDLISRAERFVAHNEDGKAVV
ncbi:hypothetical protein A1O1_02508 [Capronia coronata CBS 617.96]|uniref:Mitochondrial glycine transporter n=1 Tax=Capronia coronata CBS 617.96 TaxID=1182541 RepID=W9YWQ5_9EURO|nr:uncharacterized protein A1O1_02508 [Capronia coronata CBS 617.96]EXJ94115.1 hypothetical protein A1O1_02508 [Capronia coronata CBS 617.96]